jgi:exopolysaccharide production protein ExoZ
MRGTTLPARRVISGLQVGRAVAAVLVLLCHSEYAAQAYLGSTLTHGFFNFGKSGVDFFFVLSGFIMWRVHSRDIGRPERLRVYVTKRIWRIYPAYWAVLILLLIAYSVVPGARPFTDLRQIAASFALIPYSEGFILEIAWTLSYEIAFYIVLGVAIWSMRAGALIASAWLAISLAFQDAVYPISFFAAPYVVHFLVGIGISTLVDRNLPGIMILALGTALFGLTAMLAPAIDSEIAAFAYAGSSGLMITGLVLANIPWPRFVRFVGDASYSIYLVHVPVLLLTSKVLSSFLGPEGQIAAIVAALAAGILFHLAVEKPILRRVERRFSVDPHAQSKDGASTSREHPI